jgi:hypothetical protein
MKENQKDGICHLLADEKFVQYLLKGMVQDTTWNT